MSYHHYGFPWIMQLLGRVPGHLLLKHHFHLKVHGQENIQEAERIKKKEKVGVIFASNHSNKFDPIIVLAGINPFSNLSPMFFLGQPAKEYKNTEKTKWLSIMYGELFFYLWGVIPAHPGHKNYAVTLEEHVKALRAKKNIALFPEGGGYTKRPTPRGPARGGTGFLAEKTGALIVPVYIDGLWKLKVEDYWARNRHASITYGKPFFTNELNPMNQDDPDYFKKRTEKILDRIYALKDTTYD